MPKKLLPDFLQVEDSQVGSTTFMRPVLGTSSMKASHSESSYPLGSKVIAPKTVRPLFPPVHHCPYFLAEQFWESELPHVFWFPNRRTQCSSSRIIGESVLACLGFRHPNLATEFLTIVLRAYPSPRPEPPAPALHHRGRCGCWRSYFLNGDGCS